LLIRQNTVSRCQKYTPTDSFFGDFAHWERRVQISIMMKCVHKKLSKKNQPKFHRVSSFVSCSNTKPIEHKNTVIFINN